MGISVIVLVWAGTF
ncbi:TPA: membrane protein YpdK, partial [Enterobacter hormaechei subsp. hoffmannii]|nr:membrane protein YpdK [Enterobacter hormaechei subsp. hoffmannii]HDV8538023.1 membrane protein YpdK [Enterobacter hormaechei subsp. steigerwaltii]